MVRLLDDGDRLKFGSALTVRLIVAVLVRLPDVPVMVTILVPVVAVPLAVRVKVLEEVAGFGLKDAMTPLGRPDADRFTLPLNPFCGVTVIVLMPLAPCVTLTLPGEAERAKLGGATVTVKVTGLLQFMLGATHTANGPEVAPEGIVTETEPALQELTVARLPLSVTMLPASEFPNPEPEMTTWLPIVPALAETLLITGAGIAAVLTDTLSKVAVARLLVFPLLTPSPTYTFCPMLIV